MSITNNSNVVLAESKITHGLDSQAYLKSIVDVESKRLDNQAPVINEAYDGKKRLMFLNESYRKRYNQYLKIITICIVAAFSIFAIYLIQHNYPIIPSVLCDIIVAVILFVSFIIIMYILVFNLYIRDNVDYDELSSAYLMDVMGSGSGSIVGSGLKEKDDITPAHAISTCVNDNCCDAGTKWCPASYQCIANNSYTKLCPTNSIAEYNNFFQAKGYPGISQFLAT